MNLRLTFGSLMGLLLLLWPGAARSAQEPQVRVLLAQAAALRVVPVAGSSLTLRDGRGRLLGQRDEGLTLRASRGRIAGVSGEPQLLWLLPEQPNGSFWLQQRRYRGALLVQLKEGRLQAINRLGVESYLPSVVGAEMPHQWPDEALRVQSVAARTYALRQLRPGADYDLDSTQRSQVYLGLESETPSTRSAVASTRAQVLTHGSRLIEAVFHSSSGGRTENSGEIWRNQLPYLSRACRILIRSARCIAGASPWTLSSCWRPSAKPAAPSRLRLCSAPAPDALSVLWCAGPAERSSCRQGSCAAASN